MSPSTLRTTCESTSEYIDDPASTVQNFPVIEGIPQDKLPATYKFIPDPVNGSIARSEDDSIITEYQQYNEFKQEAQLQYTSGRGLIWELSISKLQDYFLHPVDRVHRARKRAGHRSMARSAPSRDRPPHHLPPGSGPATAQGSGHILQPARWD
jgi:hypothetical protein